jgi:hypothetical protein
MRSLSTICLLALLASAVGCSFQYAKRDGDSYRSDTRALLEGQNDAIKACYDEQLKVDPKAGGTVVVKFTVQEDTGAIVDAQVDEAQSTAPATLSQCVLSALDGLTLDPPDACTAMATYTWEFAPQG